MCPPNKNNKTHKVLLTSVSIFEYILLNFIWGAYFGAAISGAQKSYQQCSRELGTEYWELSPRLLYVRQMSHNPNLNFLFIDKNSECYKWFSSLFALSFFTFEFLDLCFPPFLGPKTSIATTLITNSC